MLKQNKNSSLSVLNSTMMNYMIFFIGFIFLYIVFMFVLNLFIDDTIVLIISNLVFASISFVIYFFFRNKIKLKSFQSSEQISNRKLIIFTSISLFVFVCFFFLSEYVYLRLSKVCPPVTYDTALDGVLIIIMSCLINPLFEESMMRLYVYNQLKRTSHWMIAMIISSAVFAFLHGTLFHIILGFIFSILMTVLYEYTGKWYIPILFHILYNVSALFIHIPESMLSLWIIIPCMLIVISFTVSTVIDLDKRMATIKYKDMILHNK